VDEVPPACAVWHALQLAWPPVKIAVAGTTGFRVAWQAMQSALLDAGS
jgi:hypothetical protein